MREIEYRGWHKEDRCMMDWMCVCQTAFNLQSISDQKNAEHRFSPLMYEFFTYDRFVLMQFTGLRDKLKKKIFEGDLVEVGWEGSVRNGVVVWHDERCCFALWFPNVGQYNPEVWQLSRAVAKHNRKVVGNVHENPGEIPKVLKRWRKIFLKWVPGVVLPD